MGLDEKLLELENITKQLESNISMEEGVKLFEKGATLAKECYDILNETKGKITQIKKDIVGEEELK